MSLRRRSGSSSASQALRWLLGGSLAFDLLLIVGLVILIAQHGLAYFWQRSLLELELNDGEVILDGDELAGHRPPDGARDLPLPRDRRERRRDGVVSGRAP